MKSSIADFNRSLQYETSTRDFKRRLRPDIIKIQLHLNICEIYIN